MSMRKSDTDGDVSRTKALAIGGIALGIVALVVAGVIFAIAVESVDEGDRAVVKDKGAVTGEILDPGWHILTPFVESAEHIEVRQRTYTMSGNVHEGEVDEEDAIDFMSRDQQRVGVDVTVRYQIDAASVDQFHRDWNTPTQYEERVLRPETMDTVQQEASAMNATEANSEEGRAALAQVVSDALNEESPETVDIVSVQIRDIHFDEEYVERLEEVERASEEANAARERAEGDADAERIRAEGEAEAIATVREQLTDDALTYEQIQAYDEGTVFVIDGEQAVMLDPSASGNATAESWGAGDD